MNYKETALQIINLVGGKENVNALTYCVTRLRFELKDSNKADIDALEKVDGVIGVVSTNILFQVIIGTDVIHVYDEINKELSLGKVTKTDPDKKNPLKRFLDIMSDSITPIIPLFVICGLVTAIISIAKLSGVLSVESSTYTVLISLRDAIFFFIPIFVANSCAVRLKVNPYIAMALAVTLVSTSINGVEGLSLFGIGITPVTYSNSFLPILMAVWFMSVLDKLLNRIIMEKLRFFLKPLITVVLAYVATLFIFGPLGVWFSDGFAFILNMIRDTIGNWFVVALYAALQPIIILTGSSGFVMPLLFASLTEFGFDPLIIPGALASDIAVAGVTFAIAFRVHKPEMKQVAFTSGVSALCAVTEPANYGVLVKYKRPYIATAIGGACGGLFAGALGLKGYGFSSAILGLPVYIGPDELGIYNFYIAIGTVIISFVTGFIASWFLSLTPEMNPKSDAEKILDNYVISAPLKGTVVPLNHVNDRVFSSLSIGKGIAVSPEENSIYAPFNATVTTLFPTNHAIGLTDENGVELLIHIGIDTVNLNGKYFDPKIKLNDKVNAGQLLLEFDYKAIENEGYDSTVICIVTNTNDYKDIKPTEEKQVNQNAAMLYVDLKEI